MTPKLYNSRRELTAYALACGYVRTKELPGLVEVSLFQEHGAYHVRAYDWHNHARLVWDSFRTYKAALTRFRRLNRATIGAP